MARPSREQQQGLRHQVSVLAPASLQYGWGEGCRARTCSGVRPASVMSEGLRRAAPPEAMAGVRLALSRRGWAWSGEADEWRDCDPQPRPLPLLLQPGAVRVVWC